MEDLVYFAFAGLFSMTLLSLTFSFMLGIKLRNMDEKLLEVQKQATVAKNADKIIIDEITQVTNLVNKKITPVLDFVESHVEPQITEQDKGWSKVYPSI